MAATSVPTGRPISTPRQRPHSEHSRRLRVCVGIITRDRPGYLRALLTSLQNLNGFSFERIFVIVENNGTFTVGTLVRDFANSVRDPVLTECEEQIGISFARKSGLGDCLPRRSRPAGFGR